MQIEDRDGTPTLIRDGKHPVAIGDYAKVDGTDQTRGWTRARVLRFWTDAGGNLVVDVTKPKQAGVRVVGAARLTKQHT